MAEGRVVIELEMNEADAVALATFCERVGFAEFRSNSAELAEAYRMLYAHGRLLDALRRSGIEAK